MFLFLSTGFFICGFSAKVTSAFIAYMEKLSELNTFIVRKTTTVSSTLDQIKGGSLEMSLTVPLSNSITTVNN